MPNSYFSRGRKKNRGNKKQKKLDAINEDVYTRKRKIEVEHNVENERNEGVRRSGRVVKVDPQEGNEENEGGEGVRRSGRVRKVPVLLVASPMLSPVRKKQKVDSGGARNISYISSSEKAMEVVEGESSRSMRLRLRSSSRSNEVKEEELQTGNNMMFNEEEEERTDEVKKNVSDVKTYGSRGRVTRLSSLKSGVEVVKLSYRNGAQDKGKKLMELDEEDNYFLHGVSDKLVVDDASREVVESDKSCGGKDNVFSNGMSEKIVVDDTLIEVVEKDDASGVEGNVLVNGGCAQVVIDDTLIEVEKDDAYENKDNFLLNSVSEKVVTECNSTEGVDKDVEQENTVYKDKKKHFSDHKFEMLYIKGGRKCGLCGRGTDGKPPKRLVRDFSDSDNARSDPSTSSGETNYDIWDGFGDEPGWLGRILGPINDRHGIASVWVHHNCAVWSPEVYFAGLGCLKNIRAALSRGKSLKCSRCERPGATTGCRVDRCLKTYHLPCARAEGCIFDHKKFLVACKNHRKHFEPHGNHSYQIRRLKAKKLKLEVKKRSRDACRKDLEAEEKWLEKCGEDEEFLKREGKRLNRDLLRIAPEFIGGSSSENKNQYQGWESVAGLQDVIQCMKEVVLLPLLYPEFFSSMGLTPPRGVLLHGYPGTGKTLVVRALIGSCARGDKKIAYFARKGADCLGKYVGDAERQLRLLFQVAEKSQPSIIFFDEIDGLAPCRTRQQDQTHNSVVSTLLALMDGLKSRGSVIVIGATNRPEAIDPALRRPGRFDREIYFPLPSVNDRASIISVHTQWWPKPVFGSFLKWIARETTGFAGADLQGLCTQAAMIALKRNCDLKKVLSRIECKTTTDKHPTLPLFFVEEQDWLDALQHAPPCSRREAGSAANDVIASPLHAHLLPCLLPPLSHLIVLLYLDERIWLPPSLHTAAKVIESVVISALEERKVSKDLWKSFLPSLILQDKVAIEIERKLVCAGLLIDIPNRAVSDSNDAINTYNCEENFEFYNVNHAGARTTLLQNVSYLSGRTSGFRVLVAGCPRSGQRHLVSCLLHEFTGHLEIQKLDLATLSLDGHRNLAEGITHTLIKCAKVGLCIIYMPRIDLWAMETQLLNNETESDACVNACNQADLTRVLPLVRLITSRAWNSLIEQVDSMSSSGSLIFLATCEVPSKDLPHGINHFFTTNVLSFSESSPSSHTVPRFLVDIDSNFSFEAVIHKSVVEISHCLVRSYLQFNHQRTHIVSKSEEPIYANDTFSPLPETTSHDSQESFTTISLNSRTILAISSFGYQILCYPHFSELCWVTSKLKEGPCAVLPEPLKRWPFNSCILRPSNTLEKNVIGWNSANRRDTIGPGIVRGLIAVGMLAYRGTYKSVREVSVEVRKVLELLVHKVNGKILDGKDRNQFLQLLSQAAYLEDIVNSWAYSLQSLEGNSTMLPSNAGLVVRSPDTILPDNGNALRSNTCKPCSFRLNSKEVEVLEQSSERYTTSVCKECKDSNESITVIDHPNSKVRDTALEEPSHQRDFNACSESDILLHTISLRAKDPVDRENILTAQDKSPANYCPSEINVSVSSSSGKDNCQCNGIPVVQTGVQVQPVDDGLLNLNKPVGDSNNTTGASMVSEAICCYSCCPGCFHKLYILIQEILFRERDTVERCWTLDDFHDIVESWSVNLVSAVKVLCSDDKVSDINCAKDSGYHDMNGVKTDEISGKCRSSENLVGKLAECGVHPGKDKVASDANAGDSTQLGIELTYLVRNNVLISSDQYSDVLLHCSVQNFCLNSIIEALKEQADFTLR